VPVELFTDSSSLQTQGFPTSHATPHSDVVVASAHADVHVREIAVKKLVATLAGTGVPPEEVVSPVFLQ
jgi:hypothetical protein